MAIHSDAYSPESCFAIINSRIKQKNKDKLITFLEEKKISYSLTRGPAHAVQLAKSAFKFEILIAVGGDGTINEVINGMDLQRQIILPVPSGTLNFLSRQIGIKSSSPMLPIPATTRVESVDLIEAEFTTAEDKQIKKRVLGFVTAGHDGRVAIIANALKPLTSHVRYYFAGIGAALTTKNVHAEVSVNQTGFERSKFSYFIVSSGGTSKFTTIKKWNMQDGKLEMQIASRNKISQFIWNILCILPLNVAFKTGIRNIKIRWDKPLPVMSDGEIIDNIMVLSLQVLPGALKMIVPPNVTFKG